MRFSRLMGKIVLQTNIQYVLWIAAFNTTWLFAYLLLDLYFFPSPLSKSVYSPVSKLKMAPPMSPAFPKAEELSPPTLLEAVNTNGLVLFLIVRCRFLLSAHWYLTSVFEY